MSSIRTLGTVWHLGRGCKHFYTSPSSPFSLFLKQKYLVLLQSITAFRISSVDFMWFKLDVYVKLGGRVILTSSACVASYFKASGSQRIQGKSKDSNSYLLRSLFCSWAHPTCLSSSSGKELHGERKTLRANFWPIYSLGIIKVIAAFPSMFLSLPVSVFR